MATFLTPVQNFHDMNGSSEDQPDDAMGKADMSCTCRFKSRSVDSEISASRRSLEKKETATSWSEFAQDTTMHGIRYVNVSDSPKITRLAWLIAILICIGIGLMTSESFFTAYFRRDTSTRFKNIKAKSLQFPKVVICDHNRFKRTAVKAATEKYNLTGLYDLLGRRYSFLQPSYDVNWSDPVYDNLKNLTGEDLLDLVYEMAPKPSEIFYHVLWVGEYLDVDSALEMVMTDLGICYQFNSNGSYKAEDAGLTSGLQFTLNVHPKDYYIGYFGYATGMSAIFYDHYDTPRVLTDAITAIRPGTYVDLALSKYMIKRAEPPADNGMADCFDSVTLDNPLRYYKNYSYNACMNERKALCHAELCGCRDVTDPVMEDVPLCNVSQQIDCMLPLQWPQTGNNSLSEKCEHILECPIPCAQTQYKTQMAIYDYPNQAYFFSLYKIPPEMTRIWSNKQATVMIFYSSMTYDYLEEYVPFTWKDVLANLGGTLGLCIGASLLTFVEFIQFGFGVCASAWSRRKQRKTEDAIVKVVDPTAS